MLHLEVSEIFKSIQGEGKFTGEPALFVRVYRCNLNCPFCDTKDRKKRSLKQEMVEKRLLLHRGTIVFTGGEPLLYLNWFKKFVKKKPKYHKWHLETNGTLITEKNLPKLLEIFDFITISPKSLSEYRRLQKLNLNRRRIIFKLVVSEVSDAYRILENTNKKNKKILWLMPLTTFKSKEDKYRNQAIWVFCKNFNIHFSARTQILIWGKRKRI